ncbi:TPA: ead/Ea22-like family protein [Klebsiella variicola subsp. variicola]
MTNITELAQSLKAAAEKWQEAWGKYDKVEITIAEFIRAAEQYESIVKDPANVLALVEALEKAQGMEAYWKTQCRGITDHCEELQARIAELEREQEQLRPVGVMSEKALHRLENSECRFIALWPRPGIFLPRKRPEDGVIVYARTVAAAGIKVEAE